MQTGAMLKPVHLMPNVGDVLGEEGLEDTIHAFDYIRGFSDCPVAPYEDEDIYQGRNRVLYEIREEGSFMALSPPPTHLILELGRDSSREVLCVHEDSLRHWLSSTTLTTLTVFAHPRIDRDWEFWNKGEEPLSWLWRLLRSRPPRSGLRTLELYHRTIQTKGEMDEILDGVFHSSCKVEKLGLLCDSNFLLESHYGCKLGSKFLSLDLLLDKITVESVCSVVSDLMSPDDCTLVELRIIGRSSSNFRMSGMPSVEFFKLKKLDISDLALRSPNDMADLLESIASPSCNIRDLGINLSDEDQDNPEHRHSSILAKAFGSDTSLSKITVLRLKGINTPEATSDVVEVLGLPDSKCKVRFLELRLGESTEGVFFKKLVQLKIPPRIECLKVYLHSSVWDVEMFNLAKFLRWEHCSLLWLQTVSLDYNGRIFDKAVQWEVASSLEANFLLTSLSISNLTDPAARSRAAACLARNRRYKALGLSKEGRHLMKSQVSRLFLCGHGEVGKSTLRKSLVELHKDQSRPAHTLILNKLVSLHKCRPEGVVPRTRGLEFHQLCFEPAHEKLAILDLGGQPDYHVFHHYFMTNTSHDLFIIVCKHDGSATSGSQLVLKLEYWLRFIVSHRNSVHGPNPKVLLVVNYFHASLGQSLPSNIQETAEYITAKLRNKYSELLDFGDTAHVFGIVALNKQEAKPILRKLERLLSDSLNRKPPIPKLCHDLMSRTLPLLVNSVFIEDKQPACGFGWPLMQSCARGGTKAPCQRKLVKYAEVKELVMQQQNQGHSNELESMIKAALVELHNTGEVVFVPPPTIACSEQAEASAAAGSNDQGMVNSPSSCLINEDISPIITDTNWFCNEVVGDLLAPEKLSGKSEWMDVDIEQVIMKNGCPMQSVDEILRYLETLELCYRCDDTTGGQTKFFFPAVASDKALSWPPTFKNGKETAGDVSGRMYFYGRRIKCKHTERHLIPSGVFARLQVKLRKFCGVDSNQGYKMGYHWASFVKDNVSVMVRFGRVAYRSGVGPGEGTEQLPTLPAVTVSMEEDDHPEWIDILLCLSPPSEITQQETISAEQTIMNGIKTLIFDICQATSRGIPTVALEECVLRHEAQENAVPLPDIEACIRSEKGLASNFTWEDQHSTPIVDLLLPEELQVHVLKRVEAIQQIQAEFMPHARVEGALLSDEDQQSTDEEKPAADQLHGEISIAYELLSSKLDRNSEKMADGFERLGAKIMDVLVLVKEIKQDVRKVIGALQQAEANIVARCSTGMLLQLFVEGMQLPVYPYLTNVEGKMQRLKYVMGKKAKVHFWCESSTLKGPHMVEGQKGIEVVVEKGILRKMAPFLVPTLLVVCCAAKFVASAYLPGVAPLIVSPVLDCLMSIGVDQLDLKSQIMPQALDALFDELVDVREVYDAEARLLRIKEQQSREGIEAIQKLLESKKKLDMEEVFGLCLVQAKQGKVQWLCKEHAKGHQQLRCKNPFGNTTR